MGVPCSLNVALLLLVVVALVEVVLVSSAAVPVVAPSIPEGELEPWRRMPSQVEIRQELQRQLFMLQAAQESIVSKLQQIESQRRLPASPAANPKRSHYSNMCMFNVVACYRKRK